MLKAERLKAAVRAYRKGTPERQRSSVRRWLAAALDKANKDQKDAALVLWAAVGILILHR